MQAGGSEQPELLKSQVGRICFLGQQRNTVFPELFGSDVGPGSYPNLSGVIERMPERETKGSDCWSELMPKPRS